MVANRTTGLVAIFGFWREFFLEVFGGTSWWFLVVLGKEFCYFFFLDRRMVRNGCGGSMGLMLKISLIF